MAKKYNQQYRYQFIIRFAQLSCNSHGDILQDFKSVSEALQYTDIIDDTVKFASIYDRLTDSHLILKP